MDDKRASTETRGEVLRKLGTALTAAAAAGIPAVAEAAETTMMRSTAPVRISPQANLALKSINGTFNVFFAHPRGSDAGSVVVVRAGDEKSSSVLSRSLKATPAVATVANGIVTVNLGKAAEGRCFGSAIAGAVAFGGGPSPIEVGPLSH